MEDRYRFNPPSRGPYAAGRGRSSRRAPSGTAASLGTNPTEKVLTARIGDAALPVGPLELRIAYKLYLGTQKDFEDAVHLYTLFEESLSGERLEEWSAKLRVTDEYERLREL